MRNIKLTLAYDGTDFSGWQIQPRQQTIQGALTDALEKLTHSRPIVQGAGRTDAGVHAMGQVANFHTDVNLTTGDFERALNAQLPRSIRVRMAEDVSPGFHSRRDALAKTYRYRILRGRVVPPFVSRYVHHDPFQLDYAAVAEAARRFEGEHDFTSFAASTGSEIDDRERITTRVIYSSEIVRAAGEEPSGYGEEWIYVIRGRSFMRYMVRKIVGTLIEVGRGKLTPEDIPRIIELRDRTKSGPTMDPQGLCLAKVEYPLVGQPEPLRVE